MGLSNYFKYGKSLESLRGAILNGNITHAYIIEGDSLIDKVGIAKAFAKAALCNEKPGEGCDRCSICRRIDKDSYEDLHHIQDDKSIKNEAIEHLQGELAMMPSAEGKTHVAIIESADTMTARAQNRLLKTLEEPKANSLILLLSENSVNLLPTVRSRCASIRINDADLNFTDNKNLLLNAETLMKMVVERNLFYEQRNLLDKCVKDRHGALNFLDALQRVLREYLVNSNSAAMDRNKAAKYISYVEEARRSINGNSNFRYAIKNLVLKMGR